MRIPDSPDEEARRLRAEQRALEVARERLGFRFWWQRRLEPPRSWLPSIRLAVIGTAMLVAVFAGVVWFEKTYGWPEELVPNRSGHSTVR